MSELFLEVVNLGVKAGWMVLFLLAVRGLFPKLPGWVRMLLWGLVAVRLVCPVLPESFFSLLPSSKTVYPEIMMARVPSIHSGIPPVDLAVQRFLHSHFAPEPFNSVNPMQVVVAVLSQIWLLGLVVMGVYAGVSYYRLRRRLREAVRQEDGTFVSGAIGTAFVLGLVKPRIYLPCSLEAENRFYVIHHEKAHIRNLDPLWKLLGFGLLAVYWFHPLMWVAYILFCRDMELACDARVIRWMKRERRADYSQALLACSTPKGHLRCPLAFGEVGVRKRVEAVLRYKDPGSFGVIVAVVLCAAIGFCFLTEPVGGGGIGIRTLRVTSHETAAAALELDYLFMEQSGYRIRNVSVGEGTYGSNGMEPYDWSLGEHQILITFGDMERSPEFTRQFPVGQVVELENVPDTFYGNLRCKVVCPGDHGFAIYIGSDKPFAYKGYPLYNVRYLGGTLVIRLYNSVPV